MKKVLWFFFIFLSIGVGIYPMLYFFTDMSGGLLSTKDVELIQSQIWNFSFYAHILTGGLALLFGWIQFSKKIRNKNLRLHRNLGKVYLIVVLISGFSGFYLAMHAYGNEITKLGFGTLSILWLYTGWLAYSAIKKGDVEKHRKWMIRNYALTWAGVMLRLWLPLFQFGFGLSFFISYSIIAWLCWVPNILVAESIIRLKRNQA